MEEGSDGNKASVENVIQLLVHIRERPGMYFLPITADGYINWREGFDTGCAMRGLFIGERHSDDSFYMQILTAHGWKDSSFGPVIDMREHGLGEAEIITELLTMDIETWKRTYGVA